MEELSLLSEGREVGGSCQGDRLGRVLQVMRTLNGLNVTRKQEEANRFLNTVTGWGFVAVVRTIGVPEWRARERRLVGRENSWEALEVEPETEKRRSIWLSVRHVPSTGVAKRT